MSKLPTETNIPIDLDAIDTSASEVEKKVPDERDREERRNIELDGQRLVNMEMRLKLQNMESDRKMREKYAGRILFFLQCYAGVVGLFLLLHGCQTSGFKLEPEILAALVGSTALAAIGLVGFIAKGLFRPPNGS